MLERVVRRAPGHLDQRLGHIHLLAQLVGRRRLLLLVDPRLDALAAERQQVGPQLAGGGLGQIDALGGQGRADLGHHRQPPAGEPLATGQPAQRLELADDGLVAPGVRAGEGPHERLGPPLPVGGDDRRPLHGVGQDAHVQVRQIADGRDVVDELRALAHRPQRHCGQAGDRAVPDQGQQHGERVAVGPPDHEVAVPGPVQRRRLDALQSAQQPGELILTLGAQGHLAEAAIVGRLPGAEHAERALFEQRALAHRLRRGEAGRARHRQQRQGLPRLVPGHGHPGAIAHRRRRVESGGQRVARLALAGRREAGLASRSRGRRWRDGGDLDRFLRHGALVSPWPRVSSAGAGPRSSPVMRCRAIVRPRPPSGSAPGARRRG